jgi:choline transport protein
MALRSDAGAVGIQLTGVIMTFFILNAVFATASRMTWALARDNALLFSEPLGHVHRSLEVPVSSILTVWAILSLCGLLILATEVAFNALVSSCVTLQLLSFILPSALIVYRRRSEQYLPAKRAFRVPSWLGWASNVWAVIMPTIQCIFFLFPQFLPVTAANMSKSSYEDNTLRRS